jgi:beta-lactamase superfamily II metal-dependent hydrolase
MNGGEGQGIVILGSGRSTSAVIEDRDQLVVVDAPSGPSLLDHLRPGAVVDKLLLTSCDVDHLGGAATLLLNRPVREVFVNPDRNHRTRVWDEFVTALKLAGTEQKIRVHASLTSANPGIIVGSEFVLQILVPTPEMVLTADLASTTGRHNLSCIIRVTHGDVGSVLLAGDLDGEMLGTMMSKSEPPNLQARVLVLPHHGRNLGSRTRDFARRLSALVKPQYVVLSGPAIQGGLGSLGPTSMMSTQLEGTYREILAGVREGAPEAELIRMARDVPFVIEPAQ